MSTKTISIMQNFCRRLGQNFDGRESIEKLKKLFIFVFRQKDEEGYLQYHKMRWVAHFLYTSKKKGHSLIMNKAPSDNYGAIIFEDHRFIKYFPIDLCDVNVSELILKHNFISQIPSDIYKFKGLSGLDLSDNNLTTLPSEIGHLISLSSLILSHNKLIELPSSLGKLTKLLHLDIDSNFIVTIPEAIINLKKLKRLNLQTNHIKVLPLALKNKLHTYDYFAIDADVEFK